MKIIKEQILKTDIKAFKGRQSFLSGLEFPLRDAVQINEKEHRALSKEMRNLEGYVIFNLINFLDQSFVCRAKIRASTFLCANIDKGKIELYILNEKEQEENKRTKTADLNLIRAIVQTDTKLLYDLQRNAQEITKDEKAMALAKEEQQAFYDVFSETRI